MKRTCLAIITMMVFLQCYAQRGYWFQSQFIELLKGDSSSFFVQSLDSECIIESYLNQIEKISSNSEFLKLRTGSYLLKGVKRPQMKGIYVSDIYHTNGMERVIVKPKVCLCLKQGYDISMLTKKYKGILTEANHRKTVYRLNCNVSTSDEVLDIVSDLSHEEGVEWCEPVKISSWEQHNPKYSQQYYLKNSGQNGGTSGIDINVEPAWNITSGNPNITVAVIDAGVDSNHEDMANCVLNGYTAGYPSGDGSPINTNSYSSKAHGVACAGIIGAENNSIGIRGVASGVKILPVNIITEYADPWFSGFADDSDIADAIEWAYPQADVMSCSWGKGSYNQDIGNAINEARTYGRNGKGTIVVCAAGNDGTNTVNFPASMNSTIAVGAIDKNGYVWDYSNKGDKLDLVAPSDSLNLHGDIVTTDRMGALGYTTSGDWNYTTKFGGTSAACPQVAGVAALMLSVNPDLTESQVRSILISTARKLPNYTYTSGWSNETGYGLVDASAAVEAALKISGPTQPAFSSIYAVLGISSSCTVDWSWQDSTTTLPITSNYPYWNQCTISNSTPIYFKNKLIATIHQDTVSMTVEKLIDSGVNFTGTYAQNALPSPYNVPAIPATTFRSGDCLQLNMGSKIVLKSPYFINANISISGITPFSWSHRYDSITVRYLYPLPLLSNNGSTSLRPSLESTVFTGSCPGTYDVFRFSIVPMIPQIPVNYSLDCTRSGSIYTFCFPPLSEMRDPEDYTSVWHITIAHVQTGKVVCNQDVRSSSISIDSSDWEPGIYAVQARNGFTELNHKIMIPTK